MNDWNQDRILVLTTQAIYNFKKQQMKRSIEISKLGGVSKNTKGQKPEFTLHVAGEYDYRFISDR